MIKSQMYGIFVAPPGQQVFANAGSYSFIVPAGIYSISSVLVSASTPTQIKRGATSIFATTDTITGAIGGGDGGGYTPTGRPGGGGAGGYYGNGGSGGGMGATFGGGAYDGQAGTAAATGSGGGGGGGGGSAGAGGGFVYGSDGGGVGLLGIGSDGAGGAGASAALTPGTNGGSGSGGNYGNGGQNGGTAYAGGSLRWTNDIAVLPGETLTIAIGTQIYGGGGNGACRILWGGGRSYPSNAGDV